MLCESILCIGEVVVARRWPATAIHRVILVSRASPNRTDTVLYLERVLAGFRCQAPGLDVAASPCTRGAKPVSARVRTVGVAEGMARWRTRAAMSSTVVPQGGGVISRRRWVPSGSCECRRSLSPDMVLPAASGSHLSRLDLDPLRGHVSNHVPVARARVQVRSRRRSGHALGCVGKVSGRPPPASENGGAKSST